MRAASEAPFPYGWPKSVCYFEILGGQPKQLYTRDEVREAVSMALQGRTTLYAVWPGQYRSDLFWIDKPELLAEAIGLAVSA
jgi:hypothetical protein